MNSFEQWSTGKSATFTALGIVLAAVGPSGCQSDSPSHGHAHKEHEGHAEQHQSHDHSHDDHDHSANEPGHTHDEHSGEAEHEGAHGHSHEKTGAHGDEESAHRKITLDQKNQKRLGVETVEVRRRLLQGSVGAWATVRAPEGERLTVRAPFSGRVTAGADGLPRIGSNVESGAGLARLVPTPGTDQMAAAKADLQQAKLNVERAERELDRVKGLYEDGALPERRLVDAQHELSVAKARRDAARNRLEQTRGVESTGGAGSAVAIRAPLGGKVVRRYVGSDSFVEAGDPLVEILSMKHRWLKFQVPAGVNIRPETIQGAWFTIADESRSDRGERLFDISIEQKGSSLVAVGSTVDPSTQTVPVMLSTPAREALRPGLFVWGHLRMGPQKEQLAIPASAVIEQKGRPSVYVKTGEHAFERRAVELGIRDANWVGIVSGVEAGERVVSAGAYYVKLAGAQTGAVGHHH